MEDLRDTHRQGRRTTGTGQDGMFADVPGGGFQHLGSDGEAPAADSRSHAGDVGADHRRRAVHGEVHARLDHRGGDHGHDGDEGLHQHAAVTDVAGVGFIGQQLGRGARADQRVEAGDGAAGDGDEQEGEQGALPHRPGAVDELGQRRHLQLRHGDQDTDGQGDDGADLEEGRQVVTRCQDQPHRQHRGDEAVADQHPGDLHAGEGEGRAPDRIGGDQATCPDGGQQQRHAHHRDFADAPRADIAHVDAHQHRDGEGRHHSEHAPGALGQGFHHDQREHREDDDHDQEGAEQRDGARHLAHFLAHQLAQRASVTAAGNEQHDEVLHRPGKDHAGDQPERAGQVAHLRGEHRAHQRAGAGDGGEVVSEENVLVGRHIVQAIVMDDRRRCPGGVQLHHPGGNEQAVVSVGDQVEGDGGYHYPQGVDRFAAAQGDDTQGTGADHGQHCPGQVTQDAVVIVHRKLRMGEQTSSRTSLAAPTPWVDRPLPGTGSSAMGIEKAGQFRLCENLAVRGRA
ncbi:hypothetical protein D3C85_980310 [compost metagenome]